SACGLSYSRVRVTRTFFYALMLRPPRPTRFPYTTLFRSPGGAVGRRAAARGNRACAGEQAAHPAGRRADRKPRPAHLQDGLSRVDRKSTRLNSSHVKISYAVFCLKKKKKKNKPDCKIEQQ